MNTQTWILSHLPKDVNFRAWCKSRKVNTIDLRDMMIFIIRKNTSLSTTQIGQLFFKDHSSVSIALQRTKSRIESNLTCFRRYKEQFKQLEADFIHKKEQQKIFITKNNLFILNPMYL